MPWGEAFKATGEAVIPDRAHAERYGLLGSRPLPFPLWCRECGVVVADSEAHNAFHLVLDTPPAKETT